MLTMKRNLIVKSELTARSWGSREHKRSSDPPLEKELMSLLGTGRDASIAAAYYGLDGMGGRSLRVVGSEYGLTYERVRQIAAIALEYSGSGHPYAPSLDRALEVVAESIPAPAAEIETKLRERGLTAGSFRLEGVLRAAKLFGRTAPFSITEVKGSRLVHGRDAVPKREGGSFNSVMRIAWRAASRWGVANLSGVVAQVRKTQSRRCDQELVASILTCRGGFRWLDQAAGWFWFADVPRNPALNRMMKILSVTNPVRAEEMRSGIARDHRMRGISAPLHVLIELCRQLPGLRVYDDKVRAKSAIDPEDVLDEAERKMAYALSENGRVMARAELEPICMKMGVKRSTFYHHLLYSPILANYAAGVYGLIGSEPA
jgi:hypothetical protein